MGLRGSFRSRTMLHNVADQPECWPSLPLDSWKDTYATLHMWTQMVGKVRLRLTPLMNHWWNVPLYVAARGLTTSSSVGFWPGGGAVKDAAFYSYMAPEPQGFKDAPVRPNAAHYEKQLGEFLLLYEEVRKAESPTSSLLEFCQSTY